MIHPRKLTGDLVGAGVGDVEGAVVGKGVGGTCFMGGCITMYVSQQGPPSHENTVTDSTKLTGILVGCGVGLLAHVWNYCKNLKINQY